MRWEMKVTNVTTRLRRRTGPSTSYRIVDYKYPGETGIVIDSKSVGNATWYKWEDSNVWSCGKTSGGAVYLTKVRDLEPVEKPTPANPVKNPEPTVDTTKVTYKPGNYASNPLNDTTNYTAYNDTWYAKSSYEHGKYDIVDDNVIIDEIARLKYNMDISYSSRDDIYENRSEDYVSDLQKKLFNSFNRNKTAFPDKELPKTFAYVFFTRPDLNIVEDGTNAGTFMPHKQCQSDPKYAYLWNNNDWIFKSLINKGNPHHKFLTFLSNEAKSFEVEDLVLKTVEHGETYNGNKIIYGRTDHESNSAGEMNIRYVDNVNLDIFKVHLLWTDYINKVSRGIFSPKSEYIKDRILDYASSCYYFLCGPDGSTILYWQKLTGVFPVNTGENAFSWDSGTLLAKPEINIKYMYSMKTPMDIAHLSEFNSLTKVSGRNFKNVYSSENCQTGSTLTHSPYIWKTKASGKTIYRLMWLDNK